METHNFKVGDVVVYGTRGKHTIISIENRTMGDQAMSFYKLEPVNYAVAKRVSTNSASILVPAATARKSGLRDNCSALEMEKAIQLLNQKDADVPDSILNIPANKLGTEIEKLCNEFGALGIAQSIQVLVTIQRRDAAMPKNLQALLDQLLKNLCREFADHRGETPSNEIEAELRKSLKLKLN
ncbi:MAG: hypothetical protein KA715_11595 [Xanthomonadaceae bacterium]|nr:hypothetical protein [Xanthomonadaceae bacterium]